MTGVQGPQRDSENLTYSLGMVFVGEDGTNPGNLRPMGNCTSLSMTITTETLDHYNSQGGTRLKDRSITTQVDYAGTLVTDSLSGKNLALFLFGDAFNVSLTPLTVTAEAHLNVGPLTLIQLGVTAANITGVRGIVPASILVTNAAASVTYASGVDYVIDTNLGTIFIRGNSTIPAASTILVSYDTVATTREKIIAGREPRTVALKYFADNLEGPDRDIFMPQVKITPEGDLSFIGDDWATMTYTLEILPGLDGEPSITIDGRPV